MTATNKVYICLTFSTHVIPKLFPKLLQLNRRTWARTSHKTHVDFNYVCIVWKTIIVNPTTFKVKTHSFNQNSHHKHSTLHIEHKNRVTNVGEECNHVWASPSIPRETKKTPPICNYVDHFYFRLLTRYTVQLTNVPSTPLTPSPMTTQSFSLVFCLPVYDPSSQLCFWCNPWA